MNEINNMGLFNYDVNLEPQTIDIRSETLEPISSSTYRYVFRLDQAGQLDSNSLLLFKLIRNGTNGTQHDYRVNPFAGGLLGIKRATFQVGDYILNDTEDIGKISSLVDMGTINTLNKNKLHSHYFGNSFNSKVIVDGGSGAGAGKESRLGGEGTIIYDRKKSGVDFGTSNGRGAKNAEFGPKVNNLVITDTASNTAQLGIPLGNLFPCLKGQELPLFLFQDYRILITVEFHRADKYANSITAAESFVAPENAVIPTEVKLQVDYLIYPSEIQNEMRAQTAQQGGLNLTFFDIIKVEKNIPAGVAGSIQKVEHRLGMDNREVHKIYMYKQFATDITDRLFLDARAQGISEEEYNVNIDGVDIFQENKYNPLSQYDETTNCLGSELVIERPYYVNDDNTAHSRLGCVEDGVLGKYKPLCLDLSNGSGQIVGGGRQIGAYPIIWKYQRRPQADKANNNTTDNDGTALIVKDETGALSVDYFVYCSRTANITSTPAGTAVMVSY